MIAIALAALAFGYPTPQWDVTSRSHANGKITFAGKFDLDPKDWCVPYDYSLDPNLEPDLGPEGNDSCGTPPTLLTVILRVDGRHVRTQHGVPASGYKGSWRLSMRCKGKRWSATLVNPWGGSNRVVKGRMRCAA